MKWVDAYMYIYVVRMYIYTYVLHICTCIMYIHKHICLYVCILMYVWILSIRMYIIHMYVCKEKTTGQDMGMQ